MDTAQSLILALQTLQAVVRHIEADEWDQDMPADFPRTGNDHITLRDIINEHLYDIAWIPDMLAGKTMDEALTPIVQGDILGDTPQIHFADLSQKAINAAAQLGDEDFLVHCSMGDFAVDDYLVQVTMFHGLRAHDIALAIGADVALPSPLVEMLWEEISPRAEEWRQLGVFGPAFSVAENASLYHKLLALTGRLPSYASIS